MRKFFITAALLFAAIMLAGCGAEYNDIPTAREGAPAQPYASTGTITVRGVVESVLSRNTYATHGHNIQRVYVGVGDFVSQGQVLATLDTASLELSIAQQQAAINLARQSSENAIADAHRMLNDAMANLANNTNFGILSAEGALVSAEAAVTNAQAALAAAEINLQTAQRNFDNAQRDARENTNPQITNAESLVRTTRMALETTEINHENTRALYSAGIATREQLRQSEYTLNHARSQYNDARTGHDIALLAQRRDIEQLEAALQAAVTARQNAQSLLESSHLAVTQARAGISQARAAAAQDVEGLRSNIAHAETAADLEHMEIALRQLEHRLEEAAIHSPISGTVTSAPAREGAVGMGLMFVVEDTQNLRIMAAFREYDIAEIYEGMEVAITADATGSTRHRGVIYRINPAPNPLAPVVEFEAEIRITSADTGLRIGMSARIEIEN